MILIPTSKKPLSPKRLKWLTIRVIKVWGFEAAFRRYLDDAPMFLCCYEMEQLFKSMRSPQRAQFLEIMDKLLLLSPTHQATVQQILPALFPESRLKKKTSAGTKRTKTKNI